MSALPTEDLARAAEWVVSRKRPLLVSHEKPDGDALGALVAMRLLLGARGVSATALLFDSMPDQYEVFRGHEPMAVLGQDLGKTDLDKHDGIIVLDTCTYAQLRPITGWLRSTALPKLAIDHHVTREDMADHYLIDQSAAATCLIVYDWARAVGWPIGTGVADALFLGMATDTGWFRYSNTDARVLSAAADLAARGGDPHGLYQQLYLREKPARVRLLGAALSGASSSTEISGMVVINSVAIVIAAAPIRKTSFKPLSRSGAVLWASPRMAGATAIPIIWKKKMAPTATPSSRRGTANWATSVLTVGIIPRPKPATPVMRT